MFRRTDLPADPQRQPDRREVSAAIGLTLLAAASLLLPTGLPSPALGQAQERIVAVGGVITEVIYALGLQDRIAGVDSTSLFPAQALRDKPNIGYVRAVSAEGVLSLKPSLILAIEGAGPPDAMSLLSESGVKLVRIADETSAEGVASKIEAIGSAVAAAEPARRLAAQVRQRFDELATLRGRIPARRRVLFVLSLQNGRVMVGGRNSTADAIIGHAGAINVANGIEGYKPMTDEAILAAAPDVILMMRNGGAPTVTPDELFAMPSFAQTPASTNKRLVQMDGLYLLGFGPRTPLAARDLMAAIYPHAAIPPLKTATAP
ncbi:hemin ABC transporter substrate-binding protein [Bosea sp. (in: a-proteobacteria)]|jgi:iron complex transport system substrate-binding protein|uniref:heme/hemin ABC transporter substrate-binding protein n=1 Tax=Bosea sp. (in: a-proteobacteria) TaxID=1871050 RepID=UPI00356A2585